MIFVVSQHSVQRLQQIQPCLNQQSTDMVPARRKKAGKSRSPNSTCSGKAAPMYSQKARSRSGKSASKRSVPWSAVTDTTFRKKERECAKSSPTWRCACRRQHATLETACAQPLVHQHLGQSLGQNDEADNSRDHCWSGASIHTLIDTSCIGREAKYTLKASIHATSGRIRELRSCSRPRLSVMLDKASPTERAKTLAIFVWR